MAPAGWSTGYAASVLGTNFLGVLGQSTYYKLGAFGGKVLITGDVTLWVTSSIAFGSGDSITITPGSTLKLYMGDQSGPAVTASLSGIGNPGFAANFQYYGLPSNSAITFSANAMFTGTIYAPSADFKLNGGGDLTVIVLDAGFASHSHFTARFRTFFGCTPTALRHIGTAGELRKIMTARRS